MKTTATIRNVFKLLLFPQFMIKYKSEAMKPSLKGLITCGSRCGYEGKKEFTLEETLSILEEANETIIDSGYQPIPCIVREGMLVGRTTDNCYREGVFMMEFSWSPRASEIASDRFYETLLTYANILGCEMQQERVYIEFNNMTEVLKKVE